MASGQHGHVLLNDGLEQRGHQLVRRRALFLQAVDVGFGEEKPGWVSVGDSVATPTEVAGGR